MILQAQPNSWKSLVILECSVEISSCLTALNAPNFSTSPLVDPKVKENSSHVRHSRLSTRFLTSHSTRVLSPTHSYVIRLHLTSNNSNLNLSNGRTVICCPFKLNHQTSDTIKITRRIITLLLRWILLLCLRYLNQIRERERNGKSVSGECKFFLVHLTFSCLNFFSLLSIPLVFSALNNLFAVDSPELMRPSRCSASRKACKFRAIF